MKRTIICLAATLLCSISFAQTVPPGAPPAGRPGQQDPARFAEFKQEVLARQQAHLAVLQQGIACISAAQNHEQLRACREQEHQAMEQFQRHQ